ncbi:MAG: SDR family oxidoreductase [Candidatus Brocadiia bacterium]|jgi:3-oxoacyl-[acyl-carrier protein] reductase|nr:SDR family oxidoreductase [Candidatus Brocadiia bacterium]
MTQRLAGRNALITGGTRGIGLAIAVAYAREGAAVALLSRGPENLGNACETVLAKAEGAKVTAVRAHVDDLAEVETAVQRAIEALGHLDILVNSAGRGLPGDIDEMPPDVWERIVRVNLLGTYFATRAVWPHFRERGGGVVINLSSGSGRRAHAGWSAYCAGKFGVMGLTDALQKEGHPLGIRVNVICPGPTDTDQRRANFPDEDRKTLLRPEHVARVAVFLASDEARWVGGPGIDVRREPI